MDRYIVGMGEALWDCLPEGRKIGGAPANFAYHVGQFGFKTMAVSAIGDDQLGKEIVEKFSQRNLNFHLETVGYPTGTVQVEVDSAGIPRYEIMEDVAWDNIPYSERLEEIARNTRVVCFGSLAQRSQVSRDTINRFVDSMPMAEDTYKVFDINLRQHFYSKEIIASSLDKCNIFKINDEELDIVRNMFGYDGMSQDQVCKALLADYNLKMLILTCGTDGSYVFTPSDESFVQTPEVEVADTVGAGDSFTAAFVASILKGKTVKDAHRIAVEISAYVCTQNGAMPEFSQDLKKLID